MPIARLVYDGDGVYTKKEARIHKLTQEVETAINNIPSVIDNVDTDDRDNALSARMGMELQNQINNLAGVGTFLSNWDCVTGLPESNPQVDPYIYKPGNYYIVSRVAQEQGETNKKPHGSEYHQGIASQVQETGTINMNDWYIYDGSQWLIQPAGNRTIVIDSEISPTSRNAVENRAVYSALTQKQNTILDLAAIREGATAGSTAIQPLDNISELTNDVGYQTAGDVAAAISGLSVDVNTKTFYPVSNNLLPELEAAYQWYLQGKNPILSMPNGGDKYIVEGEVEGNLRFKSVYLYEMVGTYYGTTGIAQKNLTLEILNGHVVSMSDGFTKKDVICTNEGYSQAFMPTQDYQPASKKYVDEKAVTFKLFPTGTGGFNTTGTLSQFLQSVETLNLPVGSAYLGQVSLSPNSTEMPTGVTVQGDVEVYVYPQNVIYAVMRSVEVEPYEWVADSYSNYYYGKKWTPTGNFVTSSNTPGSADEGMLWYDTTNNQLKVYNGSSWDLVQHSSLSAAQGGTDLSLVTTGEKYTWNNKLDSTAISNAQYTSSWDSDTTHAPSKDALYDKIDAMDTTINGKANSSDVYDKTTIDGIVSTLEGEIQAAGEGSGFGDTVTVGLFSSASGGNFGLMNNTNQYQNNVTYEANRADNTVTGTGTKAVTIATSPFWDNVTSVNKMNIYYKISGLTVDTQLLIRPDGSRSSQKAANEGLYFGFLPRYGQNANYQTYNYKATSTVPDEHVYMASYNTSGNHVSEYKIDGAYDSSALSYKGFGIWARTYSSAEGAVYYPDLANNSVSKASFSINYDLQSGIGCTPFAVGGGGKYIYYLNERNNNSGSSYGGPLNLGIFDTTTMTGSDDYWHSSKIGNTKAWKWYQAGNKCRIYFYKYFSQVTSDYQGGWIEINLDTKAVSSVTDMTFDDVSAFINTHPIGEYDNFTDWNLLINCENTSSGIAYFNGEEVGEGYFIRGWDNVKSEYCYTSTGLVKYYSTSATLKLTVNDQVLKRWYRTGKGWGVHSNIGTTVAYSSNTPISINNQTVTLSLAGYQVQSGAELTIQPTSNNLQDTGLNMRGVNSPSTSTWLELSVSGYTYIGGPDILVATGGVNGSVNISGNLSRYSRALLYINTGTRGRHSFTLLTRYMPSGEYKIGYNISDNTYTSNISSDRTSISSGASISNMLMLGYQ